MRYPLRSNFVFPTRGIVDKLLTMWEDFRVGRRERRNRKRVDLRQLSPKREPLVHNELPLVFVTRNELTILPAFLNHYRLLGVTRFICVDDQSTDGTSEFLMSQPDVDVWTSGVRFVEARRGRLWREQLFEIYGVGRWYINVDADELLVYDQCTKYSLKDLTRRLEQLGETRMPAPMIDFYGDGAEIQISGEDNLKPWKTAKYFDPEGYEVLLEKRGISVVGGPRARVFGDVPQLIKYPVIYWDTACQFGSSIHRPLPYSRNFSSTWGVLLHFKFYVNYRDKIQEAAAGRQHYNGAKHYAAMADAIDKIGYLDLRYDRSTEFIDPDQLTELGFMPHIMYNVRRHV